MWRIIILNKCLHLNSHNSAIFHRKLMQFGIQEDQLMVYQINWLPVHNICNFTLRPPYSPSPQIVDSTFHFQTILENEVTANLKKLNPHKATAVDGISAHLLLMLLQVLQTSLVVRFLLNGKKPMSLQSQSQQHLIPSPTFAVSRFYQ